MLKNSLVLDWPRVALAPSRATAASSALGEGADARNQANRCA
jgi:hypothetical protein